MTQKILCISALTLICFSTSINAASSSFYTDTPYNYHAQMSAGLTFGGEEFIQSRSDLTLASGQGYNVGFGLEIFHPEKNLGLNLFTNYHNNESSSGEANISLSRFGLGAIAYSYVANDVTAGVGFEVHTSIEYINRTNEFLYTTENYDNSIAGVFEIGYRYSDIIKLSARYNYLTYNEEVDASNVGVYFTYLIEK